MTGRLRQPGIVTLTYLDDSQPRRFRVVSGPWYYAQQLCWVPEEGEGDTVYAPIENIATWSKRNDS